MPSGPKSRTLPLGHRGSSYQVMFYQSFSVNPCVKDRFITRYDEVTLWVVERTPVLNFRATPEGRRLAPYILRATGPHAWRIFCGIGFRPWSLPAQNPGPYH
ncbi:hypothetical protein AVEN_161450-1 [Araneus ventricosus]|uniref:Uncharacterized protein n=1 Tax=Araneus ventricosus TaxID=182803 RepID=A0A4Y2NUF3_ARAVE|nr:hypothetical protein AVEN_161450-1 [Araneus ventricosus]